MKSVSALITLAELAERSGVAARTIRFYISRGLLDGPAKSGRAAGYTEDHLERLEEIRRLQAQGLTLAEVGQRLLNPQPTEMIAAAPWWQYDVAEDVKVWVQAGVSPWRAKQIRKLISQMAGALQIPEKAVEKDEQ
jgi:DNA-binding transcriptional MerR regulator